MNHAIILASGQGTRFGDAVPKQLARIAGRRVYEHTLEAFQAHPEITSIVVVGSAAVLEQAAAMVAAFPKVAAVVPGGATRGESTVAGLRALGPHAAPADGVLIHDAVRPFVSAGVISAVIDALRTHDAADTVVPCTDTIVEVHGGVVRAIPDRDTLRRGQTPQGFRLDRLVAAYHRFLASDGSVKVTDDCAVYMHFAENATPVRAVPGAEDNIKITFANDVLLAEEIFRLGAEAAVDGSAHVGGRVVIVFGGTEGIGDQIAQLLRQAGARVHVAARGTPCDVRRPEEVARFVQRVAAAEGRLDAAVVTAGLLRTGALVETPEADLAALVETNLLGSVNVARACHRFLRDSRGHLVLFSSSSYTRGRGGSALYSATKAAVANLAQGLAEEWQPDGIRVNCIAPTRTATAMRATGFGDADAISDLLDPALVARHVVQLLAGTVTGHIVHVTARSRHS